MDHLHNQRGKGVLIASKQTTEIAKLRGYSIKNYVEEYENFSMIEFELPSYKEQIKIASFLSKIDLKLKNIDEHIEQVEKFKMGLIQRMFI